MKEFVSGQGKKGFFKKKLGYFLQHENVMIMSLYFRSREKSGY